MGEDFECQKYLVVDDDPQILIFLNRLLKRINPKAQIYTAKTCTDALNLLQQHHFKMIISDSELPDGTGSSILKISEKQSIRVGISGTGVSR